MAIESLNNDNRIFPVNNPYEIQQKKYEEEIVQQNDEKVTQRRTDTLDISSEAKRLAPIATRLNEGFYDKPEIMREIAKRISYDLGTGESVE